MREAIIQYNDDPDFDGGHMLISWKELVRCKDCKHYQKFGACNHIEGAKDDPNWFCADGEKRE